MPIYKAATVDEAIQNGLNQLGLTKDQVELEILDEGKKGFLGMGRKDAQVSIYWGTDRERKWRNRP